MPSGCRGFGFRGQLKWLLRKQQSKRDRDRKPGSSKPLSCPVARRRLRFRRMYFTKRRALSSPTPSPQDAEAGPTGAGHCHRTLPQGRSLWGSSQDFFIRRELPDDWNGQRRVFARLID